jgi:hypothetical protein
MGLIADNSTDVISALVTVQHVSLLSSNICVLVYRVTHDMHHKAIISLSF